MKLLDVGSFDMKQVVMMRRERRNGTRLDIALNTNIGDDSVKPVAILMENISATGFRMLYGVPLVTGDAIGIDLPGIGERSATVVRQSGVRAGCAFVSRLTEDELQQVVAAVTERIDEQRQRVTAGWRPGAAALAA